MWWCQDSDPCLVVPPPPGEVALVRFWAPASIPPHQASAASRRQAPSGGPCAPPDQPAQAPSVGTPPAVLAGGLYDHM